MYTLKAYINWIQLKLPKVNLEMLEKVKESNAIIE